MAYIPRGGGEVVTQKRANLNAQQKRDTTGPNMVANIVTCMSDYRRSLDRIVDLLTTLTHES
jgi:hypothetical protein